MPAHVALVEVDEQLAGVGVLSQATHDQRPQSLVASTAACFDVSPRDLIPHTPAERLGALGVFLRDGRVLEGRKHEAFAEVHPGRKAQPARDRAAAVLRAREGMCGVG